MTFAATLWQQSTKSYIANELQQILELKAARQLASMTLTSTLQT